MEVKLGHRGLSFQDGALRLLGYFRSLRSMASGTSDLSHRTCKRLPYSNLHKKDR